MEPALHSCFIYKQFTSAFRIIIINQMIKTSKFPINAGNAYPQGYVNAAQGYN